MIVRRAIAAALGGAVLLAPGAARAQAVAAASIPEPAADRGEETLRFLFANPEGRPVVHLTAATIDSVGTAMSDRNVELVGRVEERYRAGGYGKPGSDPARADALAAYVFRAETAFDFFLELALQDRAIFSTSESDLRDAFTRRFRNPGLYPIVNLVDARCGFGKFALQFEVEDPTPRELEITKEKMRAWTEEIEWSGERFRVVNIDMKTMSNDRVHVVYRRYSCGEVRVFEAEQAGAKIRVVALEELSGQFVRKLGFHRPEAMVLWRTRTDDLASPPGSSRFLGSAVYFPALTLELPWFLPNVGFHDLRRFDFPEPILAMDAVHDLRRRKLDWLRIRDDLRFADWEGQGPVPAFVSSRFPDR
jgi:hypothetical protein